MTPRLQLGAVPAIMLFVDDPEAVGRWWATITGSELENDSGFWWFTLGGTGVEIGFHPADDEMNPLGRSTVPYFQITDLESALSVVNDHGGRRHRGPLEIDPGRRIAQVADPFGNIVGLDERRDA